MASMTAAFAAGGIILASGLNDALNVHKPLYAEKTADESVVSSTAIQDDDHLFVVLEANATYRMQAYLIVDATTASDFNMGWSGPAGFGMKWFPDGMATSVTTTEGIMSRQSRVETDTWAVGGAGAGNFTAACPRGRVTTAGVAGTLKLRWAQNLSGATATILHAGSWLELRRVL